MTRDQLAEAAVTQALGVALGPLAGKATATVEQVSALLGCSRSTGYQAVRAGAIPALKIGRRLVIPVPALAAMLLASPNGSTGEVIPIRGPERRTPPGQVGGVSK